MLHRLPDRLRVLVQADLVARLREDRLAGGLTITESVFFEYAALDQPELGEALVRERRQAATVILRETHPGYIMPVGVWNVREHVREALRRPPRTFATPREALAHLATRLAIPMERWIRNSNVLQHVLHQRALDDFAGVP